MMGVIIVVLALVIIGSILMAKDKNKGKDSKDDEIVSSQSLHKKVNEERAREGKPTVQAINTLGGVSTNNLARKDKSWNSVPDFFAKMAKGEGEGSEEAAAKAAEPQADAAEEPRDE